MSFGPPVAPREQRPSGRGLAAIGVLLLVQLLLELAVLGFDLTRQGIGYLPTALGFSYSQVVTDVPVGFFGYDTALCLALLVTIIGAFARGRWARPVAVALTATNAYNAAATLVNQLGSAEGRSGLTSPSIHLLLNAGELAAIVLALIVVIVAAATRTPAAPTAPPAPPAPAFHVPPHLPPQVPPHSTPPYPTAPPVR